MRQLLHRIVDRFRKPDPRRTIRVDDVGVAFYRSDGTNIGGFRWDEVEEIETFKRDLYIIDDIRLAFRVSSGWYEISEDDIGFDELDERMQERFPAIPADWYEKVMQPPFAPNQRTLWRRG